MGIPTKVYILRNREVPESVLYSEQSSRSCDALGMPWEYFEGYWRKTPDELFAGNDLGITSWDRSGNPGLYSSAAGHYRIWQRIAERGETAIVFEHDALLLHKVGIDVPDGAIVVLGYVMVDPGRYDHRSAGAPKRLVQIHKHAGAISYAITAETARQILAELRERGAPQPVDNFLFMRDYDGATRLPMYITDPVAAVGWQRKSTVWTSDSPIEWMLNERFIDSFGRHLSGRSAMATDLCEIMGRHGSEKGHGEIEASWHCSTLVYHRIFGGRRNSVRNVAEIGLSVPGPEKLVPGSEPSRPGASLRGWEEYFPSAQVLGFDADRGLLYSGGRVRSIQLPGMDTNSVSKALSSPWVAGKEFDLMVENTGGPLAGRLDMAVLCTRRIAAGGAYVIDSVDIEDARKFDFGARKDWEAALPGYDIEVFLNFWRVADNSSIVIRRRGEGGEPVTHIKTMWLKSFIEEKEPKSDSNENKEEVPKMAKEKRLKLAFLDTIGTPYNGNTLDEKGLGGSEAAVVFMSRELTKIGFDVTVFNRCDREGNYDGIRYLDVSRVANNNEDFDVLIVSRTVLPYVPEQFWEGVMKRNGVDVRFFKPLVSRSRHKVMWLHDTFIQGEEWVEDMLADNIYNEIFTLSDWHTHYIAKATHANDPRSLETMKRKIFQTRNGIRTYHDEVDITRKDPDLFIYNASVNKGMVNLLEDVWPKFASQFPRAKLRVIGGYYTGLNRNGVPDEIEKTFRRMLDKHQGRNNVHFTGVIKHRDVAEELLRASFYVYPSFFPETFGMSAVEALAYNVPLITNRAGALEEVVPEATSYLLDFPIHRNIKYFKQEQPYSDPGQVQRMLAMMAKAYQDTYLRQQKMMAANEFKPYLGWDLVALQWKQHLYRVLGLYMPAHEQRRVQQDSATLYRLFGRRFRNYEDIQEDYSQETRNPIAIITPVYNAERYIADNIRSVAAQLYDNYRQYIIDDLSTDSTYEVARQTIESLPADLRKNFVLVKNTRKRNAVGNQVETIRELGGNPIVALLDGDDFLVNSPDVLSFVNREHNRGARFTYGSCFSMADKIPLVAQQYPRSVHADKSYRKHRFNWGMPYTHLRTFRKDVFDAVDPRVFIDPSTNDYWKAGGDNSLFYPLIEQCSEREIRAVQRVLVMYNDLNPINDYKVNAKEQNRAKEAIAGAEPAPSSRPTKAYIMRNSQNAKSVEYARMTAESCDRVGLPYEYYDGFWRMTPDQLWGEGGPQNRLVGGKPYDREMHPGAASCTAGHFELWRRIRDNKETAVVFEHDAIALHPVDFNIPDNVIVNLGYKLNDTSRYDHVRAGKTSTIRPVAHHQGSHAYAITWRTAETLLEELSRVGVPHSIDNMYFSSDQKLRSVVTLAVADPTPAIAWLRGSIIWDSGNSWEINEPFIDSFRQNLDLPKVSPSIEEEGNQEPPAIENKEEIKMAAAPQTQNRRRVLIALPTAKNIETDTFLSLYRLEKPSDVDIHLECFYGYNIDQVRNLIAHFGIVNGFDYVLFVDSDMILPRDTLVRLLDADKDIVSGIYIQRKPGQRITEVHVGGKNVTDPKFFEGKKFVEADSVGFGCVLVRTKVLREVGYPQFVYHDTLDFTQTVSEDADFCGKARARGYKVWVMTDLLYEHIASIKLKW